MLVLFCGKVAGRLPVMMVQAEFYGRKLYPLHGKSHWGLKVIKSYPLLQDLGGDNLQVESR